MEKYTAIVLIGHGSLKAETARFYEGLAEKVAESTGLPAQVGYLQGQEPNLKQTVEALAAEGFRRIAVVPLFLVPGAHVTEDIPIILGLKDGDDPLGYGKVKVSEDVEILYGRHLGADNALAAIVLDRVKEVLDR